MQSISQPRYTIVVPTRNRSETCVHTLRTILACERDDVEIIVPDASDDRETLPTALKAAGLADAARILPPTPQRISMRENWERGLDAARGQWIIYIGDDDGLLPNAFDMLDALTAQPLSPVIAWEPADYRWPCYPGGTAGQMALSTEDLGLRMCDAQQTFAGHFAWATRGKWPAIGPSIYHGAVHRELIERVRARHNAYFLSFIVDYASAIANAAEIRDYLRFSGPLSILGASAKSNSAGLSASGDCKKRYEDVIAENPGLAPLHPELAESRLHAPLVAAGYRETFARCGAEFTLAPARMLQSCVDELSYIVDPDAFARERAVLIDFARRSGVSDAPARAAQFKPSRCGVGVDAARRMMFVNTTPLDWKNVADAAAGVSAFLHTATLTSEQFRQGVRGALDAMKTRGYAAA